MDRGERERVRQLDLNREIGSLSERVVSQMSRVMDQVREQTGILVPDPILLMVSGEELRFQLVNDDEIRRFISTQQINRKGEYDVIAQAFSQKVSDPRRKTYVAGQISSESRNSSIRSILSFAYEEVQGWTIDDLK